MTRWFPTRIMVVLERSGASREALEAACQLATPTDSELHLAYVGLDRPLLRGRPVGPVQQNSIREEGEQLLADARQRAEELGVEVASSTVRAHHSIERGVEQLQHELDIGLVVVGMARTGGLARSMVSGAKGTGVVRRSPASILVVRPRDRP